MKFWILSLTLLAAGPPTLQAQDVGGKPNQWSGQGTQWRGANVYQKIRDWEEEGGPLWYPKLTTGDLVRLKRAGANWVNLSVPGPADIRTGCLNQSYMAKLDEFVVAAGNAGLSVVLSFRSGPGRNDADVSSPLSCAVVRTLFQDPNMQQAYAAMWVAVAEKYKDSQHVAGYNLLVEPHAGPNANTAAACQTFRRKWRDLAQRLIDGIRSVDARTPIFISPDNWGTAASLAAWEPLRGERLVYAVSQYEPYGYTHDQLSFEKNFAKLGMAFDQIDTWREAHAGATVVIMEFGVKYHRPRAHQFLQQELDLIESRGLNHALWIWEVKDRSYTARDFDFRWNLKLRNTVRSVWKKNRASVCAVR